MKQFNLIRRQIFTSTVLIFTSLLLHFSVFSQAEEEAYSYEYTIFLTRSSFPLDWENPSTLYKSLKKSYKKTLFHKKGKRFMGHAAFNLKSNLVENDTLWMGIAPNTRKDMSSLLFKEKIGLGIIGVPFQSKIEDKKDILFDLTFNNRYTEVNFITFLVSEESAEQILEFINCFQENYKEIFPSPSNYYGGAFWPLYNGEGAGCTALCVAALESGGIILSDSLKKEWKVHVQLPMDLIGGRFNNDKKIPIKALKKRKEWHNGIGAENEDYVNFKIYDPNYMMDWVNKQMATSEVVSYPLPEKINLKGIKLDFRHIKPTIPLEEMMQDREEPCPFVRKYLEELEPIENN